MIREVYLIVLSFFFIFIVNSQSVNKFTPGEIWSDKNGKHINAHGGGMLYNNGKYYWFGENKIEGNAGNLAHVGVQCYSSANLYNWKDEGTVLKVSDDTLSPITKGCIIERPKVIYNKKNKQYVMWFHHELKGENYNSALAGLAVSYKITGPYRYVHSIRPNKEQWPMNVFPIHKREVPKTTLWDYCGGPNCLPMHPDSLNLLGRDFKVGQMVRDMTLFVDDNGSAYMLYASEENSVLHISKLSSDYLSFSGEYVRLFVNRYMEAPILFKHKDLYYFIGSGCSGWAPNAARLAVASHIFGPYTEFGNPCIGEGAEKTFNSQSTCILPVKGQKDTYIFMADRWNPINAIDGRYIWLPIVFKNEKPEIRWRDTWSLKNK